LALAKSPNGGGRRGHLIQYLTPAPENPVPLEDGMLLPLLGGLRVVHTPGHTPGSVCLYAERLRLLFTGDVLQVIRGRLTYASWFFSHDHAGARASVERLAGPRGRHDRPLPRAPLDRSRQRRAPRARRRGGALTAVGPKWRKRRMRTWRP